MRSILSAPHLIIRALLYTVGWASHCGATSTSREAGFKNLRSDVSRNYPHLLSALASLSLSRKGVDQNSLTRQLPILANSQPSLSPAGRGENGRRRGKGGELRLSAIGVAIDRAVAQPVLTEEAAFHAAADPAVAAATAAAAGRGRLRHAVGRRHRPIVVQIVGS